MPTVSIVIVTFQSADVLPACAQAMHALTYRDYEVVVVDNASHDDSATQAEQCWPAATVIRNTENRGFAAAVNQGVAQGRGRIVVTLNPDTEVQPEWLGALVAALDADETLGVAGSVIVDPQGQVVHTGGIIDTTTWRTQHVHALADAAQVQFVTGAGLAMRRADWDALGGFDEAFFPAYFEDVDLCTRVQALGKTCQVVPAARLMHHESLSTGKQSGSFYYYYHRNRWRMVLRRADPAQLEAFVLAEAQALVQTNITDRLVALLVARRDIPVGPDTAEVRARVLAVGRLLGQIQAAQHQTPTAWPMQVKQVLGVDDVYAAYYAEMYGHGAETPSHGVQTLPTLTSTTPLYERMFGGGWLATLRTRLLGAQMVRFMDDVLQHQLGLAHNMRQLGVRTSVLEIEQTIRQAVLWALRPW